MRVRATLALPVISEPGELPLVVRVRVGGTGCVGGHGKWRPEQQHRRWTVVDRRPLLSRVLCRDVAEQSSGHDGRTVIVVVDFSSTGQTGRTFIRSHLFRRDTVECTQSVHGPTTVLPTTQVSLPVVALARLGRPGARLLDFVA